MANTVYHVGCGIAAIYAGTLNPKGDTWRDKNDVTREAMDSVAQYMVDHDVSMKFTYLNKRYKMSVEEIEEQGEG